MFQPIIKLTNTCNLNCKYCYYKETMLYSDMPKHMPEDVLLTVIKKTIDYNYSQKYYGVEFTFHGGEPTLYEVTALENAIKYANNYAESIDKKIQLVFSMQSNGITLNEAYLDLCEKYNIHLGISIDGPSSINDQSRENDNAVQDITKKIINNIKKIQQRNIKFGVLSVIGKNHAGKAKEMYDFYIDNNINSVGLLKKFGPNTEEDRKVMGQFFCELFDLFFDGKSEIDIREFNSAVQNALFEKGCGVCSMGYRQNCGKYLTVTTNGDIYFCDEALKTENCFGNLVTEEIEDIYQTKRYRFKIEKSLSQLRNCENCEVYKLCRGGCHRHDQGDINEFCEVYKTYYGHIMNRLGNYVNGGENID